MESKEAYKKELGEETKPTLPPYRLDHFRAYNVEEAVEYKVELGGQFDDDRFRAYRLDRLDHFANPVNKNREGIFDRLAHQTWYNIVEEEPIQPFRIVHVDNQFGEQIFRIGHPSLLLVPARKVQESRRISPRLDHFLCYPVEGVMEGAIGGGSVSLADQFRPGEGVELLAPLFFGVPVKKRYRRTTVDIMHKDDHLTVYETSAVEHVREFGAADQFSERHRLTTVSTALLAVPSSKTRWHLADARS